LQDPFFRCAHLEVNGIDGPAGEGVRGFGESLVGGRLDHHHIKYAVTRVQDTERLSIHPRRYDQPENPPITRKRVNQFGGTFGWTRSE